MNCKKLVRQRFFAAFLISFFERLGFFFSKFKAVKIQENHEVQNVQRLNVDQSVSSKPKVLENLQDYSKELLTDREELIRLNRTSGNNKTLSEYKKRLPSELSTVAFSWTLGLVLSDATIQRNHSQTTKTCRLKIQQASQNQELLNVTQEVLKPYVFEISPVSGRNMFSLTTISHQAFYVFAEIFQNPNTELKAQGSVDKVIPSNIEDYLDPIALASWFCGDGTKSDHTPNQGKGIEFATHGFSLESNQRLAQALENRYSWNVDVVLDYSREEKDFYYIKVKASSFNSVERILKPSILESF